MPPCTVAAPPFSLQDLQDIPDASYPRDADPSGYRLRRHRTQHGAWLGECTLPFCADDPSQHLGLNEEHGHWRCLRNENHRGRQLPWLLIHGFGVKPSEVGDLLRRYGGGTSQAVTRESTGKNERPNTALQQWRRFTSAADNPAACDYLRRRHFPDPQRTAREFDLRVGKNTHARRLWFGLTDLNNNIIGFTGRALDDWRQPRYYTETPQFGIYLPKSVTPQHRLAIVTEGPMDALRVADVAVRRRHILVIGLNGLSTTGNRRLQLMQIARTVPSFAFACDASVWSTDRERLMNELRAIPSLGEIVRLDMLPGFDDPGEMPNNVVERWLSTI